MSETPPEKNQKNSTRLILKIAALSLSSLVAFAIIGYVSFNNYKNYTSLLQSQQSIKQQFATSTKLHNDLLRFEGFLEQKLSMGTFLSVHNTVQNIQKNFSDLKGLDSPLLTQAFSQFLEVKKQTKVLKSFLAKHTVTLKHPPP